ncbi:MAG: hypothetical protein U0470_01700 [Anaerolineae bacterium]
MCGIFGFAGFDEPGALARMGQRLRHRGPDDEGFHEHGDVHLDAPAVDHRRAGAGSRRTARTARRGGLHRIYNFTALEAAPDGPRPPLSTRCDTGGHRPRLETKACACRGCRACSPSPSTTAATARSCWRAIAPG